MRAAFGRLLALTGNGVSPRTLRNELTSRLVRLALTYRQILKGFGARAHRLGRVYELSMFSQQGAEREE